MRTELDLLTDLLGRAAARALLRRFGSIGEIRRATELGLRPIATRRLRAAFAIADRSHLDARLRALEGT